MINVDFPSPSELHKGRLVSNEEACYLINSMVSYGYYRLPYDEDVLSKMNFTDVDIKEFQLPVEMSLDSEKFEIAKDGSDLYVHLEASVSKWQNVAERPCIEGHWSTTRDKRCHQGYCNYTKLLDVCLCHRVKYLAPDAEFDELENSCPYDIHWLKSMTVCMKRSGFQNPIRGETFAKQGHLCVYKFVSA